MTIPRLELHSAVLGTRLMDTVGREHDVSISRCVVWIDRTLIPRSQAYTIADEVQGKATSCEVSCLTSIKRMDVLMPPIILSHEQAMTEMILGHYHEKMKHQNLNVTMGKIRTKFWKTILRRVLQNVKANCNICKLRRVRSIPTLMR